MQCNHYRRRRIIASCSSSAALRRNARVKTAPPALQRHSILQRSATVKLDRALRAHERGQPLRRPSAPQRSAQSAAAQIMPRGRTPPRAAPWVRRCATCAAARVCVVLLVATKGRSEPAAPPNSSAIHNGRGTTPYAPSQCCTARGNYAVATRELRGGHAATTAAAEQPAVVRRQRSRRSSCSDRTVATPVVAHISVSTSMYSARQ